MFLEVEKDHYISNWSPSNCMRQREMRQWLHKLWVNKPQMRELIWKEVLILFILYFNLQSVYLSSKVARKILIQSL